VLALLALPARAASPQVPDDALAVLLLRILAYDRALVERAQEGPLSLALLYLPESAASRSSEARLREALHVRARTTSVAGRRVRLVSLPWEGGAALRRGLVREQVVALFLCPDLGPQLEDITRLTRQLQVLTAAASEDYVERGASIGIVREESRARVLENLAASRQEGAVLGAGLLRIARLTP
jgi:hypothetical protein